MTEWRPGARVPAQWWEQGGVDWEGEREAARVVEAELT